MVVEVEMGKYADRDWYIKASKEYIDQHDDVPAPWIICPTFHPYSIGWRMGRGESFMMVWGEWWEQMKLDFDERLAYFRKYPPPPRWFEFTSRELFELDPWGRAAGDPFDYLPYFEKLTEMGFEGAERIEEDMNDKRWD